MSAEPKKTVPITDYDRKKLAVTDKISDALGIISGIFLSIATVFMFTNICTRTFADYNFLFIYDLCGLCAAGCASFAIPYATFKRGHANMDTILTKLKPRTRGMSEGLAGILTMCTMLFTIYAVTYYAIMKTKVMESTTTSGLPTWIFRWLFVIGLILTTIAAAIEMVDAFRLMKGVDVIGTSDDLAAKQEALEEGEVTEA